MKAHQKGSGGRESVKRIKVKSFTARHSEINNKKYLHDPLSSKRILGEIPGNRRPFWRYFYITLAKRQNFAYLYGAWQSMKHFHTFISFNHMMTPGLKKNRDNSTKCRWEKWSQRTYPKWSTYQGTADWVLSLSHLFQTALISLFHTLSDFELI